MKSNMVYLDNAAATPIFPEVVDVITEVSKENFANPSSAHSYGNEAAVLIDDSKKIISKFLNCGSEEIYFTSSGTESNNLAILGFARANKDKGNHIITTNIEHPSILNACKSLEKEGFEITYLKVGNDGLLNLENLEEAIKKETILISTHYGNSELGVIQAVHDISYTAKKHNVCFHIDACQATAYLDIDIEKLGVDVLTINGSKAYGPRGIAVLYVREGLDIFPIHFGGGQQNGLRSGTENIAGIVGFSKALEIIKKKRQKETRRITSMRNKLQDKLEKSGATVNAKSAERLPNHLSVVLPMKSSDLVKYFNRKGFAVSAGSACSSKSLSDSYVLQNIGLSSKEIHKTIRISLGYFSTEEEVSKFLSII